VRCGPRYSECFLVLPSGERRDGNESEVTPLRSGPN